MKLFLAGLESRDTINIVKQNLVENAFFSYYYMRKKDKPSVLIESRPHIKNIIIDSGAHTFFSEMTGAGLSVSVHTKKTKTKDKPEDYFQNYVKWLKSYWDYFDYFVELDIGEIVTQKKVLEWREQLKKEKLYTKCITVYHPDIVSFKDYIDMLEDSQSKYVALEGDRPLRKRLPYNKLIKEAYQRGIKVHGFAFTKWDALETYPFYSVDSTSWKAGIQYGASVMKTPKGVKNVRISSRSGKHQLPKHKIFGASRYVKDFLDIYNEDKKVQRDKLLELTAKAYTNLQDYYSQLWEKRGILWK